jgi:hypothetical protein
MALRRWARSCIGVRLLALSELLPQPIGANSARVEPFWCFEWVPPGCGSNPG